MNRFSKLIIEYKDSGWSKQWKYFFGLTVFLFSLASPFWMFNTSLFTLSKTLGPDIVYIVGFSFVVGVFVAGYFGGINLILIMLMFCSTLWVCIAGINLIRSFDISTGLAFFSMFLFATSINVSLRALTLFIRLGRKTTDIPVDGQTALENSEAEEQGEER